MILLIDKYDSFTYNVKQEIEILGFECKVFRNNQITVDEVLALSPQKIVLSPGPGRPEHAGIMIELLQNTAGKIPVFGICLGLQAIGYAHGAAIVRAEKPMHGKISLIQHQGTGVFENLPKPIAVARYHSLVIDRNTLSPNLEITAETESGEIMGVRSHLDLQEGVQFHPESIATESGRQMMKNFLTRKEDFQRSC